jgi:hypothetical protein
MQYVIGFFVDLSWSRIWQSRWVLHESDRIYEQQNPVMHLPVVIEWGWVACLLWAALRPGPSTKPAFKNGENSRKHSYRSSGLNFQPKNVPQKRIFLAFAHFQKIIQNCRGSSQLWILFHGEINPKIQVRSSGLYSFSSKINHFSSPF